MKIFIGSLPFTIEDSDLEEFFGEYGEVSSAKVITDKYTGKGRGFGFVEMPDNDAAKKAIEELNGAEIEGRTIVVNEAIDKPSGGDRRGGGGRGRDNRSYGNKRSDRSNGRSRY